MRVEADSRQLLIPFASHGSPDCRAALVALQLPNLQALLNRLAPAAPDAAGADSMSPPHERALAAALGLQAADGCLPWAALAAAQAGLHAATSGQGWAFVTLCHWDVAIDEVVLGDWQGLGIDESESEPLLRAAQPFFAEDGIELFASALPGRWLARSALFVDLPTASLDRATGQPISAWSAGIESNRTLRRLQNEMQMLLYTQRVNDDRSARGASPLNSFWLSGSGALPPDAVLGRTPPTVDERLRAAALQGDGVAWAAAWQALDAGPLAALRQAQAQGESVTLTLCGERVAQRWQGTASWAKRFFGRQRPSSVLEPL